MQLYPRILVNVLVISVNVPVSLLVKLAKLRVRGAMGLRGVHLGEARDQLIVLPEDPLMLRTTTTKHHTKHKSNTNETIMGLLLGYCWNC